MNLFLPPTLNTSWCLQETDPAEGYPATCESLPGPGLRPPLPGGWNGSAYLLSLPASLSHLSSPGPHLRHPSRHCLQAGQQRRDGAGHAPAGHGGAAAQVQGQGQLPRCLQQSRPHLGHGQRLSAGILLWPVRRMLCLQGGLFVKFQIYDIVKWIKL